MTVKGIDYKWLSVQAKAASDAWLARDIQEAEDRAEANAAEEARLRQEELDSIDRYALSSFTTHQSYMCCVYRPQQDFCAAATGMPTTTHNSRRSNSCAHAALKMHFAI